MIVFMYWIVRRVCLWSTKALYKQTITLIVLFTECDASCLTCEQDGTTSSTVCVTCPENKYLNDGSCDCEYCTLYIKETFLSDMLDLSIINQQIMSNIITCVKIENI